MRVLFFNQENLILELNLIQKQAQGGQMSD